MDYVLLKGPSASDAMVIWLSIILLIVLIFTTKWTVNKLTPIIRKYWVRLRGHLHFIV